MQGAGPAHSDDAASLLAELLIPEAPGASSSRPPWPPCRPSPVRSRSSRTPQRRNDARCSKRPTSPHPRSRRSPRRDYLRRLERTIFARSSWPAPGTSFSARGPARACKARAPSAERHADSTSCSTAGGVSRLSHRDICPAAAHPARRQHRTLRDEISQSEHCGWMWGGTVSAMHLWVRLRPWERLAEQATCNSSPRNGSARTISRTALPANRGSHHVPSAGRADSASLTHTHDAYKKQQKSTGSTRGHHLPTGWSE